MINNVIQAEADTAYQVALGYLLIGIDILVITDNQHSSGESI